jgi:DNA-binding NarL/FixJ family response regulator
LLKLDRLNAANNLNRLCTETKVIILSDDISEDLEWALLMTGVRGYCRNNIRPGFLRQAVIAVQKGELWMRRSLTGRLSDELGKTTSINNSFGATSELLNILTQREYDIAICVGNGESNKKIAQSHAITERTVKAHLTGVYHKLGISDRLNLALMIASNDPYQNRGHWQLQ